MDNRRPLQLVNFDQVAEHCRELLRNGYRQTGNWSLGQICRHMRLTQEAQMLGYPRWMCIGLPLRPLLKKLLLPRLLAGDSPIGLKTAASFVPPEKLEDQAEVELYLKCIEQFQRHSGPLHPHPGFGRMTLAEAERFHAAHAAHHLRFLEPTKASAGE